jgi:hypothetical protein
MAVPTVAKSIFECPREHLDVLRQCLPEVRTLLVVGWRGQERTFLDLLREFMDSAKVRGTVVSSGRDGAEETRLRLVDALPKANIVAAESKGFSTFLLGQDGLEGLLEASAQPP